MTIFEEFRHAHAVAMWWRHFANEIHRVAVIYAADRARSKGR